MLNEKKKNNFNSKLNNFQIKLLNTIFIINNIKFKFKFYLIYI